MFNHQQRDLSALRRLPGLIADELPWHSREAKFDLQLHSEEDRQGRLTLSFDYADELFEQGTHCAFGRPRYQPAATGVRRCQPGSGGRERADV